jgi:hypothetical protein
VNFGQLPTCKGKGNNPMDFETFAAATLAFEKGAALVYHKIADAVGSVLEWEHDNPAIQPFVETAITVGNALLTAHGLPVATIDTAATLVLAALKTQAANDMSVYGSLTAAGVSAKDTATVAAIMAQQQPTETH